MAAAVKTKTAKGRFAVDLGSPHTSLRSTRRAKNLQYPSPPSSIYLTSSSKPSRPHLQHCAPTRDAAVNTLWFTSTPRQTTSIPRVKPGAEAPLARPTLNSVKATILCFGKINSVFQGSRAYLFALDMVLVAEEGDFELFAARVYAYNNVCRLDAWYLR